MLDRSLILAGGLTAAAVDVMLFSFLRGVISRGFIASMSLFNGVYAALLVALRL